MRLREVTVVAGLLFWGTASTVLSKVLYQLRGKGRDGHVHHFDKPLASTALMFAAMALVLPVAILVSYMERRRKAAARAAARSQAQQPLLQGDSSAGTGKHTEDDSGMPQGKQLLKSFAMVSIPTSFDLIATTLMNVGLLFVTASVFQMMRGAEMVFSAVYAVAFLHRSLNRYHYTGLVTAMVGISIVGIAGLHTGQENAANQAVSTTQMIIGMTLIVAAQAVQAAQITVEDYMMDTVQLDPLLIVGCEGIWGLLLMGGIFLPIAQFMPAPPGTGLHEDSLDTFAMLKHSHDVRVAVYLEMAALALYNIFGMWTTDDMGSVARTVLECLRTLFVWVVDLMLYYITTARDKPLFDVDGNLGEPWVTPASLYQLAGFIVLVVGTLIYSEGDEVTAEAHRRDAAAKGHGQLIKKHRHHIMKHTHQLSSVAWTVTAIKGAERRARWKSVATRALEAEQRMMAATAGEADPGSVRVRTDGILL